MALVPGKEKAVVLLSGGLDSLTVLAIAQSQGFDCHALSFRYGQRHALELEAAQHIAKQYQVAEHLILTIELDRIGGSALTDTRITVPNQMSSSIPVTYVPARNTIFLSYALAWAEVLGANVIFIGVNALDYSGYPDCRPEYIEAFEQLARLATQSGVEGQQKITIQTPLINMRKSEIIRKGLELGLDYAMTISCYQVATDGQACGVCEACRIRRAGFQELGIDEPQFPGQIVGKK